MFKVALTGGIACGKSLTGQILAHEGIPVCEADRIGHDVLAKDESVRNAVIHEFGNAIVAKTGNIDRMALARIVFEDPEKREKLNALTHPVIMQQVTDWMNTQAGKTDTAAAIIPLLYEIGAEKEWDKVICVAAPESDQLHRLEERGLSHMEARARIKSQMDLAMKMERADYVIYNCGSQALLEEQTKQVMRSIRGV